MQKLILPINKCGLTASWKTAAYQNKFRAVHYGADLICSSLIKNRKVYASGDGVVVGAGKDNIVGNVVAVLYFDAYNHRTGKTQDVIVRYFHLNKISVPKWQKVNKDTVLGEYGNTGILKMDKHLHIEVDTDIANPMYSPTSPSKNLIKGRSVGANDKTMSNPLGWFYAKATKPDYQSYTTANDRFIQTEDRAIPKL